MHMNIELKPFDAAAYLDDEEEISRYVEEAFETGNAAYINHALGVAARAQGMSQVSRASGLKREALYRALSREGNPQFSTVLSVMKALGFRLKAEAVAGNQAAKGHSGETRYIGNET